MRNPYRPRPEARPFAALAGFGSALVLAAALLVPGAGAGEISKTYDFRLDNWVDLKVDDGPVSLHRFRVEKVGQSGVNRLTRGGSSEYSTTLEIQLEYTNSATDDWKAYVILEFLDERGNVIDGYRGDENMDEGDRHEIAKMSVTTLKYGIDRARKMRLEIRFDPD